MNEYTKYIMSLDDLSQEELGDVDFSKYQGDGNITFNQVKTVLFNYVTNADGVYSKTILRPDNELFGQYGEDVKKKLKRERRILYYRIINLWHEYIEYRVVDELADDEGIVTMNDTNWKKYLSGLQYKEADKAAETAPSFTSGFSKGFKFSPKEFLTEDVARRFKARYEPQLIWNPESKGGVLIAGHNGKTCEIEGTSIKAIRNQEDLNYIETMLD